MHNAGTTRVSSTRTCTCKCALSRHRYNDRGSVQSVIVLDVGRRNKAASSVGRLHVYPSIALVPCDDCELLSGLHGHRPVGRSCGRSQQKPLSLHECSTEGVVSNENRRKQFRNMWNMIRTLPW